ncbi:MAG TPA: hypothetical protein VM050_01280 [Patescibacteria group bacterium]|nr:hypothetical protein [Patescibacteria group bacterium]
MLSGSRREWPFYAVGLFILAFISQGYLDRYPSVILLYVGIVILAYYFMNPDKDKEPVVYSP